MLIAPPTKEDFDILMNRVLVVGGNRLVAYQRADRADASIMSRAQESKGYDLFTNTYGMAVETRSIRRAVSHSA